MPLFSPQPSRRPSTPFRAPHSHRAGLDDAPLTPPPAPGAAASQLLRRYRPLETRATGGFGSVEICLDGRLQRRVAIKRMPLASPYNHTSTETTATALAEARTASMLQHPHIVSVIDFTYDQAYAYLVMEYVDGMSLEEFLAQVDGNSLTYDEAACIADALVQALAYAHENGVLHLDIKPANVLIDRSGHVKLADFGMATLASAAGFGGARGGTIGYMPPEQLDGERVDERTDIFALACVLYEGLCATAPFRAGTPADSRANIERGVLYPSDLLPDIPEATEEALLGALAPQAEDRMASVDAFGREFLAGLGDARAGRESLARMIARLTSDDEDPEAEAEPAGTGRVWELDPAEGHLGSRWPQARRVATGVVGGASVAALSWMLLGTLQVTSLPARGLTALAIGTAAGAAPQLGSALAVTGFLALIVNATPAVAVAPVVALVLALAAGWWIAWGRVQPAASAVFALVAALAGTSGNIALFAPLAAAFAGYALPPVGAAASTAAGILFARLFLTAQTAQGALPAGAALASLADLLPWGATVAGALAAAATSWLLERTWQRSLDGRGTGLAVAACLPAALFSLALPCLAHPMEIASVPTVELAAAAGTGALSSILVALCIYAFGYRKDPAEGDRP